jgi:hypothetical protein
MDLDDAFATFRDSAFRLELRPSYRVEEEERCLRGYFAGDSFPDQLLNSGWTDFLKDRIRAGRTFSRVRAIPTPLTPYFRCEMELGYVWNDAAGERIVFLPRMEINVPRELPDFWLFDDRVAFAMIYNDRDEFLHSKPVETSLIPKLVEAKTHWLRAGLALRHALGKMRNNLL